MYHQEEYAHKKAQSDLDITRASNEKLQAQLKDVQGQLALVQDKNKEADQKINNLLDEKDLNEGLRTALKKENAKLKEQVANIELSKQKIKTDLDDSVSKLSQYQQLLKAAEDKGKELEARLATLAETNKSMESKIDELKAGLSSAAGQNTPEVSPPGSSNGEKVELDKIVVSPQNGIQGHILSIDPDAEFVIFNLGMKEGIKPDDLLSVFQGDKYLGDIKATRVQDELSAADIIPPLSISEIHKNDTVVLKP